MSSICPMRSSEGVCERGACGGRCTGRDMGDRGRWREVCINIGSAPPFELVSTAIPVDLRIENSDNAPKGFYGAAPTGRNGRTGRSCPLEFDLSFKDCVALKATGGS